MGVYELASRGAARSCSSGSPAAGRCSVSAASSRRALREGGCNGASFRFEVTTAYLSRYRELLMAHVADHGAIPSGNTTSDLQLGRLSPG